MLWRNFQSPESGAKFQREVPLVLKVPEFPYNTVHVGQVERSYHAKTSPIRSTVSREHRLVIDRQTRTHGHSYYPRYSIASSGCTYQFDGKSCMQNSGRIYYWAMRSPIFGLACHVTHAVSGLANLQTERQRIVIVIVSICKWNCGWTVEPEFYGSSLDVSLAHSVTLCAVYVVKRCQSEISRAMPTLSMES